MSFNQEITVEQFNEISAFIPEEKRSINHFCADHIYKIGGCVNPNCPRKFHSSDISMIRNYLNDSRIKNAECKKGSHCTYYLCTFIQKYDHLIFGYRNELGELILPGTQEDRDIARQKWIDEKTIAYNEELISGVRKPKNEKELNIIRDIINKNNDINKEDKKFIIHKIDNIIHN